MISFQKKFPLLLIAVAILVAISLTGCDSKSPTAPERPAAGPPSQATTNVWNITVTASPSTFELPAGGSVTVNSTITVTVRSASNNQSPPDGATVIVSTSVASGVVSLQNGTGSAILTFVATSEGSIEVQASLEGSVGRTAIDVVATAEEAAGVPLFIERVSPDRGSPVGGERIRIIGTGFEEPIRVFFGGSPALVRSVSSTVVVVESPTIDLAVGSTSTVSVTVNVNVNQPESASDTLNNAFTYTRGGSGGSGGGGGGGGGGSNALVPRIISISPTSGPNEGGTQVTINGEGFSNEVQVFFGTTTFIEAPVLSTSESRLVVRTPSATGFNDVHQNALVNVLVRNLDSGFEDTLTGAYQYGGGEMFISGVSPDRGFYLGGENVTIFGQNFEGPAFVQFDGVNQNVISVSGTEILLVTEPFLLSSCQSAPVEIEVINLETNERTNLTDGYTYLPIDPEITGFTYSPDPLIYDVETGAVSGTWTMTGNNVDSDIAVTIGGVLASTDLTGTFPAFTDAMRVACSETEDPTPGDGQTGERYIESPALDVVLTSQVTGCFDTLFGAVVYEPSDTSCQDHAAPLSGTLAGTPDPAILPALPAVQVVTVRWTASVTNCNLPGLPCTYNWSFGPPTVDPVNFADVDYTTAGPKTVSVTVTRAFVAPITITGTVTVEDAP